jgi:hypothetical protein
MMSNCKRYQKTSILYAIICHEREGRLAGHGLRKLLPGRIGVWGEGHAKAADDSCIALVLDVEDWLSFALRCGGWDAQAVSE